MIAKGKAIPSVLRIPLSLYSWVLAICATILFSVLGVIFIFPISLCLDHGTRHLVHGVAVNWGRFLMRATPVWNLKVEGLEHIQKGKHYVIVGNHQSMLDIMVVLAALPCHFKFMAKRELYSVPFIGWHMALAGYIGLDRQSKHSGRAAVVKAKEWLDKGVSVLLFPEGTRSLDLKIHAFKIGAFKLARESGLEILPVVIDGTGSAVPKKSLILRRNSELRVSVGKPVHAEDISDESLSRLRDQIRHEMMQRLAKMRKS
ncbi:1-acyl-sn-glycerol-3-phosphate acyltransferase [Omnitrophica bacterium]|nr:1-acyl-sn-glycerol-3-phosphate acyltransferase [Candidatus Omnitrophota bacterium]